MPKKKNTYIKWFREVGRDDVDMVGGKGANLGEMVQAKFPVPDGFVVTSETYFELVKRLSHVKNKKKVYPEIKKKYHYLERREKERIYPKIKKIFGLKD